MKAGPTVAKVSAGMPVLSGFKGASRDFRALPLAIRPKPASPVSITIVHLDGPLEDRRDQFGDEVGAVVVGRSAEAQIAYPEECIGVSDDLGPERDDAGGYTIEPCGADDAEIDGEPAEDGTAVSSGSVIALGAAVRASRCCCRALRSNISMDRLLVAAIFCDSVAEIIFGRSREDAQVVYPPDYAVVA